MSREEAIQLIDEIASSYYPCDKKDALEMAIKALEPKPYEKFESAKDHIYKLAGDYKCWDNRLTEDEAVELCHILEQQPCEDTISRKEALEALKQEEPLVWCDGADEIAAYGQWSSDVDTIKNLPSVQPKQTECEDAISRKYAIDAVADLFEISEYPHPYPQGKPIRLRDIKEKLKQLPPVTPQPKTGHWISVNERLPEKAFGCLVTVEEDDIHGEPHKVIYPDFVGYDGETWNDADGEVIPFDVIAWMPLPELFEPQESEEE